MNRWQVAFFNCCAAMASLIVVWVTLYAVYPSGIPEPFDFKPAHWGITVFAQSHGTASEEVPRGVIDGVNATFTLNFQPLPFASLHLFRNGLRLHRGVDYTLGGQFFLNVIFSSSCPSSCIPQPGDVLLADYTY